MTIRAACLVLCAQVLAPAWAQDDPRVPPPMAAAVQVDVMTARDERGEWFLRDRLFAGGAQYEAWTVKDSAGAVLLDVSGVYIRLAELDAVSLHAVDGDVLVKDVDGEYHRVP